jgi:hypothetical protein
MTEACLESKESTSRQINYKSEHPEVPKEEAVVDTFQSLKKQHGDQHLAVGRREKLKEQTQSKGGF